jgi:hypothetical protein
MSDQGYASLTLTRPRQERAHSPSAEPKDANVLQTALLPASVIQHAVRLCFRLTVSLRDVEEMLPHRGVDVSYETIR